MCAKSFAYLAALALIAGLSSVASAQYGPSPGPVTFAYPGAMPPGYGYGPGAPAAMPAAYGYGPVAPAAYQCAAPSCAACGAPAGGCGCNGGGCDQCGGCGCKDCGCGGWTHRMNVFGEFLYLRARDAEVAYAVPIDSNFAGLGAEVQVGPVETVDPDYQPGFRAGFGFTLDECTMIQISYAQLDSDTTDDVTLPGGLGLPVLRSLVENPNPLSAAADGLDANAQLALQFKLADVDYKGIISSDECSRLIYVVGARYAKLSQEFEANFAVLGTETVVTDIDFEGAGLKLGLEGERFGRSRQLFVYGKGDVSFIAGESQADYFFGSTQDPTITDTSLNVGRMVTITNIEVGAGWENYCGNVRISGGYMINTWYNIMRTNEFIHTIQENNFADPSDNYFGMMTFEGLTAKVEVLW